jgi:ectoine hydroxylase-related dioxygenase (phytanoyl-CoA dioxygenase family)
MRIASLGHPECRSLMPEPSPRDFAEAMKQNGFAVVERLVGPDDIVSIRKAVDRIFENAALKKRELGERGGAPQIIELPDLMAFAPELARSRFYEIAKTYSEAYLGGVSVCNYAHAIIKPPMNKKETAWHQDSAYHRPITFCRRRVHWWLPLHDVSVEQGCMQFVPGSHKFPRLRHTPVAPSSDAVKAALPAGVQVVKCPLAAGSASAHLPNTLHCTGANMSDRPRQAFIVQFARRTILPRINF